MLLQRKQPADGACGPVQSLECAMRIESDGHSSGNPRLYELIEHTPKTGKSPTVWAWPQLIDYLKVAGQPVPGPWPPHQEPRPDPEEDTLPVAVAGRDDAKVLAGGQSLVPLMKLRFASPELIVDINNLPGLDYHQEDPDGTIRVGALCRH